MFRLPRAPDALPPQKGVKRYLLVQRFGFAVIGLDPTSLECTICNYWLALVPVVCIFTLIVPMAWYALEYISIDLEKMASALTPMWQSMLAIVKFFLFMWKKKEIVQLVRKMWFWTMEANSEEQQIIADENYYDSVTSAFYYGSVYITGILAVMSPVLIAAVYAWEGYNFWESLEAPLKAVYLIDSKGSVWTYSVIFVWNAVGISYVVNGTIAIDSLFSWFTRNISAQFRILNLRFKLAAANAAARKAAGSHSDAEFAKSIVECVKYHKRVIEMSEDFNEIYKTIVFIKFLISCLQLACLSFLIPIGVMTAKIYHVSFLISVSTQLMLYCYGGQRIKDMSSSVYSEIYEYFQWHDLSVKSQKLLLLPMMRSLKPCGITGIFFIADFTLFVWVFRTAASFMTMMVSVEQTDK